MATVDVVSPRTIRPKRILKDLSREELRELARPGEKTSEYGSPVYSTRVKNRSAKNTYVVASGAPIGVMQQAIDRDRADEAIRQVQEVLAGMELIQVDRRMGMSPEVPIHCRLFVPKEYARIAYMWHNMLFPSDSTTEPDFISVYVPDWKERLIFLDVDQGYTYILGTDYPGEAKKSMLRQAMYWIKRRGGLGLHAGSKVLRVVGQNGELSDVGFLLFGLSGTGKTTLTLHDHGLKEPERAIIKQDDVVLMARGRARLRDRGRLLHQDRGARAVADRPLGRGDAPDRGLREHQGRRDGKVDFLDTSLTSNGRGVVLRKFIQRNRRGDRPATRRTRSCSSRGATTSCRSCARLTAEQAAAYFMLGESIETSAGDPTKAGQAKREVGTNPFIVGPEAEEGNRLLEILRENPDMQAYILNTGSIGARDGSPGEKITIKVSTEIMKQIAKEGIEWETDPDWGYEIPTDRARARSRAVRPAAVLLPDEVPGLVDKLRDERREWLAQVPGTRLRDPRRRSKESRSAVGMVEEGFRA